MKKDSSQQNMYPRGDELYSFAAKLFPICRSITGNGVRQTLQLIKEELPKLTVHEVPTGTRCFDWTIPNEWNIKDAYIITPQGKKICDFKKHNLHIVGYSEPKNETMTLEQLEPHLHSLPDIPDAVPYAVSYYHRTWGFCITHNQKESLTPGDYRVFIDSTLEPGHLTYGELLIPGQQKKEIFVSTYICHPSMGNNEVSGPTVVTQFAKYLLKQPKSKYSVRIVFIPETIGSIAYLSKNLNHLKSSVIAGFNVSCVGDDRTYSYLESRNGSTLADRVAAHVLAHICSDYKKYTFLDRGSDERQYCAPGVDLPMVTIMRSKYGTYPEYHTSKDNMSLISPKGLLGGFEYLRQCVLCVQQNVLPRTKVLCEPQLGKYNLYYTDPTMAQRGAPPDVATIRNLVAFADGQTDLLAIAEKTNVPMERLMDCLNRLTASGLIEINECQ